MTTPTPQTGNRTAVALMYLGAVLTTLVALFPYVDRQTTTVLADHIRAGYPAYVSGRVDDAVTMYLVILATIGVLGVLGWSAAIWAARTGAGWARYLAAGLLVVATGVALAGLTVRDTSGEVGLAPLLGWLLLLPCLPGLAAVALWRRDG